MADSVVSEAREFPHLARAASRTRARRLGLLVAGWLVLLMVWQLAAMQFGASVLPGPGSVLMRILSVIVSGEVLKHFVPSLLKIVAGFLVALVLGVPVGYLMGRHEWWKSYFSDAVNVAGLIPPITFAILSLIIFGISLQGPILAVALVAMPYIAFNVSEGMRSVDRDLTEMSRVFGRSLREIRRHVFIPSLAPFVFAAVRLAFAIAWKIEALTEVFGGRNGVGFQLSVQFGLFDVEGMIAWTLLFVGFMLTVERLVLVKLEAHILSWRPSERVPT